MQGTSNRPKRLPNRRRCHSTPPWSLPDISPGFYRRNHSPESLHIDPHMLPAEVRSIQIWAELPLSTLMLINGRYVLKMIPITWDVDAIVHHMRVAGSVVPVPRVHDWGRSVIGNSSFMLMDYVRGICFSDVVQQYGHFAAVRLKPQIASIVERLAALGLSHGDLHPRNIMVDEYYNVVSVLDWDYAARIDVAGDEYLRRVTAHYSFERGLAMYADGDSSWDPCFLRYASDRGEARYRRDEFLDARVPPASYSCFRRSDPGIGALVPRDDSIAGALSSDSRRRIVLLVSGSNTTWSQLIGFLRSNRNLNVCLVVLDDPGKVAMLSDTSGDIPWRIMHPDYHVPHPRVPVHRKEPPQGFDTDLAEAVTEARAHVVVLCDWHHKFGDVFRGMVAVPPVLSVPHEPLTVLRLNETPAIISLTSHSRSAPPSLLAEHSFSAGEVESSAERMQRCYNFASTAARRVAKLTGV